MRFGFNAVEKAHHQVAMLWRCLRVTRSGFCAWVRRGVSARAQRGVVLKTKLRAFHAATNRTYGRPRLWKDLREDGGAVSHKRVARRLRTAAAQANSENNGAPGRGRTCDPRLRRPMLYPLSYGRMRRR